jgi:hypothetical protein
MSSRPSRCRKAPQKYKAESSTVDSRAIRTGIVVDDAAEGDLSDDDEKEWDIFRKVAPCFDEHFPAVKIPATEWETCGYKASERENELDTITCILGGVVFVGDVEDESRRYQVVLKSSALAFEGCVTFTEVKRYIDNHWLELPVGNKR